MTWATLFDLEGTLVQTLWENPEHVVEFRVQTRKKLIDLAIPSCILEGIERSTLMRNEASEYVKRNFSDTGAQKFHAEMTKFLKKYELDAVRNSRLFSDTVSTFEELKRQGTKMGLVTNTSREAVDMVFKRHSLEGYFNAIITREDVDRLKPDPEGILLALRKLSAKSFFMVGDLVLDVLAARNAKGISIIVKRNPMEEVYLQADYSVQSLSEVPSIIQKVIEKQSPPL